jgi:hypothetical protein
MQKRNAEMRPDAGGRRGRRKCDPMQEAEEEGGNRDKK